SHAKPGWVPPKVVRILDTYYRLESAAESARPRPFVYRVTQARGWSARSQRAALRAAAIFELQQVFVKLTSVPLLAHNARTIIDAMAPLRTFLARTAMLLFAALALACASLAQQVPSAKNARILLVPRKMISGDRITLAVLDVGGRLTPNVTVMFSNGDH